MGFVSSVIGNRYQTMRRSRSLFDLFSGFNFYRSDPVNGDDIQQHDSRLQVAKTRASKMPVPIPLLMVEELKEWRKSSL